MHAPFTPNSIIVMPDGTRLIATIWSGGSMCAFSGIEPGTYVGPALEKVKKRLIEVLDPKVETQIKQFRAEYPDIDVDVATPDDIEELVMVGIVPRRLHLESPGYGNYIADGKVADLSINMSNTVWPDMMSLYSGTLQISEFVPELVA